MKKTFLEKAAYGFIMVVCAFWLVPLIWVVLSAFKSNSEILVRGYQFMPKTGFTLDSFKAVLANEQAPIIRWALNSLIVSVFTCGISFIYRLNGSLWVWAFEI